MTQFDRIRNISAEKLAGMVRDDVCISVFGGKNSECANYTCVECWKKFFESEVSDKQIGYSTDEEQWTPDTVKHCLELILDIAVDYDGYETAEGLKSLIDEMRDYTKRALKLLNKLQKMIYATDETKAGD